MEVVSEKEKYSSRMRRNRRQTKTVNRKPKIVNCGENKSWERGNSE